MPPIVRVLVLTDEARRRTSLRRLLATTSDLQWVGEATRLPELPALCQLTQPQIILASGGLKPFVFDLPALIQQVCPQTKIIALLDPADPIRVEALLATDLAGCLFQQEIGATLLHGIRAVAQGGEWVSRGVVRHLFIQTLHPPQSNLEIAKLNKREQKILALVGRGYDNAQIAEALQLADHTVRNYVSNVCKKLDMDRQTIQARWGSYGSTTNVENSE